jgi:class 3 adenylate cyclase
MAVILFSAQVDSTATRAKIGEDAADALRRQHDALVEQAVTSHEGRIMKWMGDGMAAAFDSASAAIEAAIDIQRRIAEHNRRRSAVAPLAVRIGISAATYLGARRLHGSPWSKRRSRPPLRRPPSSAPRSRAAGSRVDVDASVGAWS